MAAGFYYYERLDDELRLHLQHKVAELYPHLSVSIGSAKLLPGEGIRLRDISVVQPDHQQTTHRSELAFVDEVFLRCRPGMQELLQGDVQIEQVVVRHLLLRTIRTPDGGCNLQKLFRSSSKPLNMAKMPAIQIENASLELIDRTATPDRFVSLNNINLTARFQQDAAESPRVTVEGVFSGDHLRQSSVQGELSLVDYSWRIAGTVSDLRLSPELYQVLPSEWSGPVQQAQALRGTTTFEFHVASPQTPSSSSSLDQPTLEPCGETPQFQIVGKLDDARYQGALLYQPISDLHANYRADNRGFSIENASALFGDARIDVSLQHEGFHAESPFWANVSFRRLLLHKRFFEGLPEPARVLWHKFQPTGRVSGGGVISFNGAKWNYDAKVTCDDIGLVHYKFPYPVEHCQGELILKENTVDIFLEGLVGASRVRITGLVQDPGPRSTGWAKVESQEWIDVDDRIVSAANEQIRRSIQSLRLRGQVGVWAKFTKHHPDIPKMDRDIILDFSDASINYLAFPYPVNHISGRVRVDNDQIDFQNFQGRNDNCQIYCEGSWNQNRPGHQLVLDIDAKRIPLDGELKSALNNSMQRFWESLNPRGHLQSLSIDLGFRPKTPLALNITAVADSQIRDDVQIFPTWFPYRISNLAGEAKYQNGSLRIENLSGQHGSTRIRTNLDGTFGQYGGWKTALTELSVEGIRLDSDLKSALPAFLTNAFVQTQLQGQFRLNGRMEFSQSPGAPLASEWDLFADIDQASFQAGLPFHGAFGQTRFLGQANAARTFCRGNIHLESLMYQDYQVTNLRSPFLIDSERILLGSRVPSSTPNVGSPPLEAVFNDGILRSDIAVQLSDDPTFDMRMTLAEADLASLARESGVRSQDLGGRLSMQLSLQGAARGVHTLRGNGAASVRDANLYELPVVLAIIERMRSGKRDSSAFTNSEMKFRVDGEHIYFDEFVLAGDALTLKGQGDVSLKRDVNLDFYSIVGRENLWLPEFLPVVREAGRQFMLIHVDGTLDKPQTTQEMLPGLNETLQRLFPEHSTAEPANSPRAARSGYGQSIFRRR